MGNDIYSDLQHMGQLWNNPVGRSLESSISLGVEGRVEKEAKDEAFSSLTICLL